MDDQTKSEIAEGMRDLLALMERLRAPDGCPWDREQTHRSIKPMTIEEAYEVAEAIDDEDDRALVEELGDLLLQVVFHSQIAADEDRFTLREVIRALEAKLIRRHPHVFGDARAETPAQVLRNWEQVKLAEKAVKARDAKGVSLLAGVTKTLPAVMEALEITTKTSRVGFDWPSAREAFVKVKEEMAELSRALDGEPPDPRAAESEIGDLLFAVVNVARLHGVDPETALKAANRKFRRRFQHIERRLEGQGRSPLESSLEEMDALWNEAKAHECVKGDGSEGTLKP
ncbi:MAG: nucleoside triphosphate pyrophosphohydrolase [Vicinamibacteria bacterium]|nr:nucleoside triphosphate pyrophosphohydrolase [Vicinamibacteria bacterium]